MSEEWMLVAAIIAAPFLLYGMLRLVLAFRAHRHRAAARRAKDVPRR